MNNKLFYGDNLGVLREHVADASVDLVYLDPPFNSNATYNVLFEAPDGVQSQAQIEAFDDTWHWTETAENAYWEVLHGQNTDAARMLEAMRGFLGENDMMAYLAMMAIRLIELHRVLKPTGSLYLHCDPTASHYLKLLLDAIFGAKGYRTEISWKRSSSHNDGKQGRAQYGNIRDVIFFYTKSSDWKRNWLYTEYDEDYVNSFYRFVDEGSDRRYRVGDLTAAKPGGDVSYEWRVKRQNDGNWHADLENEYLTPQDGWEYIGVPPYKGRFWAYSQANMRAYELEGRLFYASTGMPGYKRYLDEMEGVPLQNDWRDLRPVTGKEKLGYPTQKPVALLERIISASSNPGDVVLDPFCGCGTTVHAAQKLGRQWIGIDVTHLAISLIERRLRDAFGKDAEFTTYGVPKDLAAAKDLATRDKHEFEKWAITLIPDAQPFRGGKKGADTGIDGIVYLRTGKTQTDKAIVEVKGGGVSVDQIHKLKSVIEREKAMVGLFVTLQPPTKPMIAEAAAAGFVETDHGRIARIQILTIDGILNFRETPRLPVIDTTAFKKAPKEKQKGQGALDL
jgi:DNA modification methylase